MGKGMKKGPKQISYPWQQGLPGRPCPIPLPDCRTPPPGPSLLPAGRASLPGKGSPLARKGCPGAPRRRPRSPTLEVEQCSTCPRGSLGPPGAFRSCPVAASFSSRGHRDRLPERGARGGDKNDKNGVSHYMLGTLIEKKCSTVWSQPKRSGREEGG